MAPGSSELQPMLMLDNPGMLPGSTFMMDGVPPLVLGLAAISLATLGVLALLLLERSRKLSAGATLRAGFACCALNLFGVFTLECDYIDEVYTNLEHPWNLLHHGLFSSQPHSVESGTADILYYGLLTPFAQTQLSLTAANFVLGLLLSMLALGSLWTLGRALTPMNRTLLVLGCSLSVPLLRVMSDGLGTSVIGAGFLCALACFDRKPDSALGPALAASLPLWRPDALSVTAVLLLYVALVRRRLPIAAALGALAAFAGYFALSRAVYGVWVPTPLVFKSFKLSMLPMLDASDWFEWLAFWWRLDRLPLLFFAMLALFAARTQRSVRFALVASPLLGVLVVIFAVNTNPMYNTRYAVGLEAALLVWFVLVAVEVQDSWPQREVLRGIGTWVWVALLALELSRPLSERRVEFLRASDLGYGGQVVDRLMPKGWRLAVTEMNTIGFVGERRILDLWGYTNRRIASSRFCSEGRVRNDDRVFLDAQPEVFLYRTGHRQRRVGQMLLRELSNPTQLLTSVNMHPYYNQLGDMRAVLRRYQPIALTDPAYLSVLLVRVDKISEFLRRAQLGGYHQTHEIPLDGAQIEQLYQSQRIRRYNCG